MSKTKRNGSSAGKNGKDGKGRVAAFEILVGNAAVANNIREGKTYQLPSVLQTGRNVGMCTLNDDLLRLVREGSVDPDQAYAKAIEKKDMASRLQAAGFRVTG